MKFLALGQRDIDFGAATGIEKNLQGNDRQALAGDADRKFLNLL